MQICDVDEESHKIFLPCFVFLTFISRAIVMLMRPYFIIVTVVYLKM